MKRLLFFFVTMFCCIVSNAQYYELEGKCGENVKWGLDGETLTLFNSSKKGEMGTLYDYAYTKNKAPWRAKNFKIKKVIISQGIGRIGACAFAGCSDLLEVEFNSLDIKEIGWGAFLNCSKLRKFSIPSSVKKIETIAFANCNQLPSISIPAQCNVADYAFLSCSNIKSLDVASTASLGYNTFATEVKNGDKLTYNLYNGEIRNLPPNINVSNATTYGISASAVEKIIDERVINRDMITSEVDSMIPSSGYIRSNTYALIIGNENYRFAENVSFAVHDANTFANYCKITLGIPSGQIHICENATKSMIMDEEFEWLNEIQDRSDKSLIIYYAGHGVPDTRNKNKAYLLPTDIHGTKPQHGISLDDFYSRLGDLEFAQTTVFLDACFSGSRDDKGVVKGQRGVEIAAEEGKLAGGNVLVFSAAQGNETAQSYHDQGHGLFTYCLLKSLKESNGFISFGNLADDLRDEVSRTANGLKSRQSQTPETSASDAIKDIWRQMTF